MYRLHNGLAKKTTLILPCCTGEIFIFPVRYVLVGSAIAIFFRQSEVYNVHKIAFLSQPHQEVVWFDIPMDEIPTMYVVCSTYLQNKQSLRIERMCWQREWLAR